MRKMTQLSFKYFSRWKAYTEYSFKKKTHAIDYIYHNENSSTLSKLQINNTGKPPGLKPNSNNFPYETQTSEGRAI